MKAARIYGIKDLRIEDIPITDPKPGEVQIKVSYTGICGSDVHGYEMGWALPTIPHPITGQVLPVVLGHESSGVVVKLGEGVENVAVGDRVAVEPLIACGECEACRKGLYNCCENAVGEDGSGNVIGFGADGGFAEYVNTKARTVFKVPDSMDDQLAALVEPAAVAVQAVHKSGLKVGQSVAIFGAGPIGLLVSIVAITAGATDIFMVDISEQRLQRAKEIGVKYILNPKNCDVIKEIMKITGNGVDIAYDVAGVQSTLDSAIDSVKNTGKVQIVAVFAKDPVVRLSAVLMKGVDILTTLCYSNVYPEAIRLIDRNQESFRKVITKVIKLDDLVKEGLALLTTDKSHAKILVSSQS